MCRICNSCYYSLKGILTLDDYELNNHWSNINKEELEQLKKEKIFRYNFYYEVDTSHIDEKNTKNLAIYYYRWHDIDMRNGDLAAELVPNYLNEPEKYVAMTLLNSKINYVVLKITGANELMFCGHLDDEMPKEKHKLIKKLYRDSRIKYSPYDYETTNDIKHIIESLQSMNNIITIKLLDTFNIVLQDKIWKKPVGIVIQTSKILEALDFLNDIGILLDKEISINDMKYIRYHSDIQSIELFF